MEVHHRSYSNARSADPGQWSCERYSKALPFRVPTWLAIPAWPPQRNSSLKTFKEAVRTRDFVITARITLAPETDATILRQQADLLRESVDAILLTDNQFGELHMSTLAASALLVQNGIDPIMQLACRNRNRIALLGDLFGAAALGVTSLVLVRGIKVPKEIKPRPKAVFDVTATELIATAMTMKIDEQVGAFSNFFIGGTVTPHNPEPGWVPENLISKITAGAQFVQMPICMNVNLLRRYMKHLVANRLVQRISVIAGTAILPSADAARWLRDNRRNVRIPETIIDRLEHAGNPEQEGVDICAEQLRELAEIPGISGANIMPGPNLGAIPATIQAANLNV